jgi:hypothetical protein
MISCTHKVYDYIPMALRSLSFARFYSLLWCTTHTHANLQTLRTLIPQGIFHLFSSSQCVLVLVLEQHERSFERD